RHTTKHHHQGLHVLAKQRERTGHNEVFPGRCVECEAANRPLTRGETGPIWLNNLRAVANPEIVRANDLNAIPVRTPVICRASFFSFFVTRHGSISAGTLEMVKTFYERTAAWFEEHKVWSFELIVGVARETPCRTCQFRSQPLPNSLGMPSMPDKRT